VRNTLSIVDNAHAELICIAQICISSQRLILPFTALTVCQGPQVSVPPLALFRFHA
jgi:hypothetical protein